MYAKSGVAPPFAGQLRSFPALTVLSEYCTPPKVRLRLHPDLPPDAIGTEIQSEGKRVGATMHHPSASELLVQLDLQRRQCCAIADATHRVAGLVRIT